MHYGWNTFAIDRKRPTITNTDGSPVVRNRESFTKVNKLK